MQKYCRQQFHFLQVANFATSLLKQNQVSVEGSASGFRSTSLETGLRSASATEVLHIESLSFPRRGAFSTCVSSHSHFYQIYL